MRKQAVYHVVVSYENPANLFVFFTFLGTFFIANSNALIGATAPQEYPSLPEISLQLQLRNSSGMLVAYLACLVSTETPNLTLR